MLLCPNYLGDKRDSNYYQSNKLLRRGEIVPRNFY